MATNDERDPESYYTPELAVKLFGSIEREPDWRSMDTAPRDATWVLVKLESGAIHWAHYAEDLSGEEQPPFRGWFRESGNSFYKISEPIAWAPDEVRDA